MLRKILIALFAILAAVCFFTGNLLGVVAFGYLTWLHFFNSEDLYDRTNLVSFGNYLLSDDRNNIVSEVNKKNVTHADVENWIAQENEED